ncbi:unnamed protein product [Caenorhabditis bovis]|uniref:sphinganine-1-phosphate aldolase n=1 Tax=Caenorhabditis bovis TaxID=2654633 RepID=A0A8S1F0B0_9PELO|nr:unnamed protein product [Caenorhabditis bovis]
MSFSEHQDRELTLRIFLDYLDEFRVFVNSKCSGLEPWQVISYAISLAFFVSWIRRMFRSNDPPLELIKKSFYAAVRSLPWVRKRIEDDLARARAEIEEEVHQFDQLREFYKFLPERCMDIEDILADARRYAMMGERRYMQHYDPQTKKEDLALSAKLFDLFSHSDPHRSDAFPGVRKMEAEILKMCCAMFHGGKESCGVVAGGGTEALLLACLAYRNRSRARGEYRAEIIAPSTAHPALDKAAEFFDMTIKRIPVCTEDDRANVGAMKRAIGPKTCMIIASAPNHITGTVDPIEKLAKLAQRYHIPLHVDCTLGGFVLPFMEFADYSVPAFDFRLPGVTSISADLHRYGQSPGRLSVLMYREPVFLRYQFFVNSSWTGGSYATPTMNGGRDGGAVATSWATMLRKGRDGYVNACQRIVEGTRLLADKLSRLDGIGLRGSADLCVVAFAAKDVNIYNLVDKMVQKGWHVDPLRSPEAARVPITLSMCEDGVIDSFVEDLLEALRQLRSGDLGRVGNTASFYRMLEKVSDRSLVDELALIRLAAHYSIPPSEERRSLRTLSVEGRKLSMMGNSEQTRKLEELRRSYQKEKEEKKNIAASNNIGDNVLRMSNIDEFATELVAVLLLVVATILIIVICMIYVIKSRKTSSAPPILPESTAPDSMCHNDAFESIDETSARKIEERQRARMSALQHSPRADLTLRNLILDTMPKPLPKSDIEIVAAKRDYL